MSSYGAKNDDCKGKIKLSIITEAGDMISLELIGSLTVVKVDSS
eukprot:CAMPEP_0178771982 /NCGR_PEP_ID=MMETSP0744-20121128/22281_1 /TAXON_ID=913974 /ORGANISM="Nitzschia punctata, Strain CCMP561" /LENGTH=43 /DNA_ID= /DNA_START= /DNA_END= /DNA_ORIENTATION=